MLKHCRYKQPKSGREGENGESTYKTFKTIILGIPERRKDIVFKFHWWSVLGNGKISPWLTGLFLIPEKLNLCSHKNLHINGYSTLDKIAPNWKLLRGPFIKWTDKQIVAQPYCRLLTTQQQMEPTIETQNNLHGSPEKYAERTKGHS